MSQVFKYRILVQVRTDLTPEEIAKFEASKGPNANGPSAWPYRDTGEILHARRRNAATAFYRALRQIKPIIKIRAIRIPNKTGDRLMDHVQMRAWRGFRCLCGSVNGIGDEVKHFGGTDGVTACGTQFNVHWGENGKPECDKCLAAAVEKHPEMKEFL